MIALCETPIDRVELMRAVRSSAHGGEAFFFGCVREVNQGRRVLAVSYEAHPRLCVKRFEEIVRETTARYAPASLRLALVHRVGKLFVGEVSVAIGASSTHRDEAFAACRDVIEAVKHEAPIWKLEHFEDGDSEWVRGHSLCARDRAL